MKRSLPGTAESVPGTRLFYGAVCPETRPNRRMSKSTDITLDKRREPPEGGRRSRKGTCLLLPSLPLWTDSRMGMAQLPFQIERYIIKQLACEVEPETIADEVRSQFLRDVTVEDVRSYRPEADNPLSSDLRELYHSTRRAYAGAPDEAERDHTFVEVATLDVFEDRAMHCVEVDGTSLALFAHDGHYTALDNRCTHQGGPLCEGELEDGVVECPWHGARFDVESGAAQAPPAPEGVSTYEVRVRENRIEVKL